MTTSENSTRRFAMAAVAAAMALTATAMSATPAKVDEWRRHHGCGDHEGGWNGGFSIYSGPSYYYAPAPTYYYAPPPPIYYAPPPAYYTPPSFGFSINVPLRGRY